jgi:hypothetical protein
MIAQFRTLSCALSCDTLRNTNQSHAALTRSFGRLPLRERNAKFCRTAGSPVKEVPDAMSYTRTGRLGTEFCKLFLGGTILLL